MSKTTLVLDELNNIEICHQGAHPNSWLCEGKEQFFVSEKALYQPGQAIRGGVPLIFPQFGAFGSGAKHGFARTADWTQGKVTENSIEFFLSDSEATLAVWPHKFDARFTTTLSQNSLTMSLHVSNTGDASCEFTAALHTYFRVSDILQTRIGGLQGSMYWDNNGSEFSQRYADERKLFSLDTSMDRVYFDVDNAVTINEDHQTRNIVATGFRDVVVWNPWLEGARDLSDMAESEYRNMLCVESATVDQPTQLAPGESWLGEQKITLR